MVLIFTVVLISNQKLTRNKNHRFLKVFLVLSFFGNLSLFVKNHGSYLKNECTPFEKQICQASKAIYSLIQSVSEKMSLFSGFLINLFTKISIMNTGWNFNYFSSQQHLHRQFSNFMNLDIYKNGKHGYDHKLQKVVNWLSWRKRLLQLVIITMFSVFYKCLNTWSCRRCWTDDEDAAGFDK